MDWSVGHYEYTAAQLLPAARVAIERAAPAAGERLVDVGCGTGNAALLAAARGASVTGVDPAARLLEVARGRAAVEGAHVDFVAGDAAALPLGDGSADVIVSVFGVIFAPDAEAAASELARVAAPDGRVVLTAWLTAGPIAEASRESREAIARASGAPPGPPPFPWHERPALAELLGPYGFELDLSEHELQFVAASVDAYMDAEYENHPFLVSSRPLLERSGEDQRVRRRVREILTAANEDDDAFRVTSRYVVAVARRSAGSGE